MNLPEELNYLIQNELGEDTSIEMINNSAKKISQRYRSNSNTGTRLLTKNDEAIAYAMARMPATYGAIYTALLKVLENNEFKINDVFDIGAGTGAGTWATYELIGNKDFYCFEREDAMLNIGKKLMINNSDLVNAKWKKFDIINDEFDKKCDLAVISYMINELPKEQVNAVIDKIWKATNNLMLVVEPGTPVAFENIKMIRQYLINQGAYIVAPCTHQNECQIENNDWCAFSCRVQRTQVHKMLKDGEAPYEDEKFSYIAFSKNPVKQATNRILRHPIINKGYAEFKVCTADGVKNIRLSKKDGQLYKQSKKKSAGDCLEF